CLGPGVPERDLLISPMHRVVIRHPLVALLTGSEEVLCPARLLVNGTTVTQEQVAEVGYHHLLFDRHEVLSAGGCDSESFYPGELGLDGFGAGRREEVLALFPELRSLAHAYGPTARGVAKRHEALILADSLSRGARPRTRAA
ncbi:MAG: Hint domain-containing protein, partial [Roseovarius sp.]|nr:Hint domain-containing protein [Roseovarius sp.]